MIKRATIPTWAKYFERHEGVSISDVTIRKRLKEAGKLGEDGRNRVRNLLRGAYFSEVDVRSACADLLSPMPKADESGLFVLGGIRHGTFVAWSRELGISEPSIVSCLRSSSAPSVRGKDSMGHVLDFYPEPAVREACTDLLRQLPQADESGFFVLEGVRYGTVEVWSREFGVTSKVIVSRFRKASIEPRRGRVKSGNTYDFYPEPDVRQACADLLNSLPQSDRAGFFVLNHVRYGNVDAWHRELGISTPTINDRLSLASALSIRGRGQAGCTHDYYPEPAVRAACSDLLCPMPQADESGFFDLSGIRHGTVGAWSRDMDRSPRAIAIRIRSAKLVSVKGKDPYGHPQDFYPEPAVRAACSELIGPLPQADESGFFDLKGVRHGTVGAWSRILEISAYVISRLVRSMSVSPVRGKSVQGKVHDFFPEPAVREACKGLIENRNLKLEIRNLKSKPNK